MGQLFGSIGLPDSERAFTSVQGQQVMWKETQRIFDLWQADMEAAMALFVQGTTTNHKERYELPGGGQSQDEDDASGASMSASVKRSGSWDVGYPLAQSGDALSYDDVALGYLTLGQYEAHVQTVINRNNNWVFYKILKALMNNTNVTYKDKIFGSLTCVPLANTDGTLYPPVYGSVTEAEENFYLAPDYSESGISSTNNPFLLVRQKLEPHYGFPQGGSPIVTLVNSSAVEYARALPGFNEYTYRYLEPGADVTTLTGLPGLPDGGRIVGFCDGSLIYEWPRMPTGWMAGIHLEALKPLKRRIDPADTGLAPGLQLTTKTLDSPYRTSRWRNRQGFGVGNRLGAVMIALNGTSSYSVPTIYQ
jgi:hypothetical protein